MDAELQGETEEVCYLTWRKESRGDLKYRPVRKIPKEKGRGGRIATQNLSGRQALRAQVIWPGERRPPTGPWRYRHTAVTTLMVEVINPHNGKSEKAYAMADTGASNTHVSSSLGRRLGLRGVLAPFVVGSHGGRVQEYEVMECQLQIGSVDGSYKRDVSAKCYPNPCGQMEAVDWRELWAAWAHLKHLPLPAPIPNRKVELIIGTDCLDAIEAITPVVFGEKGDPCAKLTKLGWIVGGRTAPRPAPRSVRGWAARTSNKSQVQPEHGSSMRVCKGRPTRWFPAGSPRESRSGKLLWIHEGNHSRHLRGRMGP